MICPKVSRAVPNFSQTFFIFLKVCQIWLPSNLFCVSIRHILLTQDLRRFRFDSGILTVPRRRIQLTLAISTVIIRSELPYPVSYCNTFWWNGKTLIFLQLRRWILMTVLFYLLPWTTDFGWLTVRVHTDLVHVNIYFCPTHLFMIEDNNNNDISTSFPFE